MKNSKRLILTIICATIFVLINFPKEAPVDFLCFVTNDECKEIIRFVSIILYCAFVIPKLFSSVLDSDNVTKRGYYGIHLIYILLPIALIFQNTDLELKWITLMTLIVSLITAYLIYKKIRQKKLNIIYLKFSHLVVSTIFTIACLFLDAAYDKINIKVLLFSVSLLLMLQVVYEKIDLERKNIKCDTAELERKEIKCDTAENEHATVPDTVEKEQPVGNKEQGNAKVSGTVCVNLKIEI